MVEPHLSKTFYAGFCVFSLSLVDWKKTRPIYIVTIAEGLESLQLSYIIGSNSWTSWFQIEILWIRQLLNHFDFFVDLYVVLLSWPSSPCIFVCQVMVFVHARNATVRTAMGLIEMAKNLGEICFFQPDQGPDYGHCEKQVKKLSSIFL